MAMSIMRSAGSVMLGLIVAFMLVVAVEFISAVLHPFPPDFEPSQEAMFAHVANYPAWVLALLGGAGWAVTAFVSTWLATRLGTGRHPAHGIAVGVVLLVAAGFNISMLPYPVWFMVLDCFILPLGIYFGIRLGTATRA